MQVTVFVHPVDATRHPDWGDGWRWAVHLGDGPPGDLSRCANAGHEPSLNNAKWMGDRCGATLAHGFRLAGILARYSEPIVLDHDPTPVDDRIAMI